MSVAKHLRKPLIAGLAAISIVSLPGNTLAQTYTANTSYANPDGTTTDIYRSRGPCSDPWVTIALMRVFGKADPQKCNIYLYNNGQWGDYNQLVQAVVARLPRIDCRTASYSINGRTYFLSCAGQAVGNLSGGTFNPDQRLANAIVAAGGLNLIGNDGASVVSNDGAGIVAGGGGNLLAALEGKLSAARIAPASGFGLQSVTSYQQLKAASR